MGFKKIVSIAGLMAGLFLLSGQIYAQTPLKGAWESTGQDAVKKVAVATDDYFIQTTYDTSDNQFLETLGGPYKVEDGFITFTLDFHSGNGQLTGQTYRHPLEINGNSFVLSNENGGMERWYRVDEGTGPLAGCWQITQRQQNNKMHTLPDGSRKTLKILSGTRFQWTAFNTATGEFSGCGGGHYTFEDGKYTEHIDYFSRDNSRVGMSLSFEGKVSDSLWHHKGKSTKGNPVYEIWKLR